MSTRSQRKAILDEAMAIMDEIAERYPGAKSLGAGELAAEIARITARNRASAASIANALRSGEIHNGQRERGPIEHDKRRIWNIPVKAAALNIAEIIHGVANDVSVDMMFGGYRVSNIQEEALVIRLDYKPETKRDPENPTIEAFLYELGVELQKVLRQIWAQEDYQKLWAFSQDSANRT